MKIGILQTGRTPPEMRAKHGDYDDLFRRFLDGRGFEFDTYRVLEDVFPENIHAAQGWLITGSKFGVYESHGWIAPLEEFLRQAFAAGVPIIGVCFGHQILAQALGGKVEKYAEGWSVGAVDYAVKDSEDPTTIIAWHQDQVVKLPPQAEIVGSSDFCKAAMLAYGQTALTIQPHPEFTAEFAGDLLDARRNVLPDNIAAQAEDGLDADLMSASIADRFEAFFKQKR